ncbi:MAG: hypothetical protein WCA63_03790 [Gallionella sp.]
MKQIKTSISTRLAALLAGAALFGLISQSALALTTSGTTISNTATLNYTVATVAQTPITSVAASFVVDDKVNVTVAGGVITTPVAPGSTPVTPFTVTNNGNAHQGYNLVAADAASGAYTVNATAVTDDFNAGAYSIFLNPTCDGVTPSGGAITQILSVPPAPAAGSTVCLVVQGSIPLIQVNGDEAVVSLKATTLWPSPLVAAEEPIPAPTTLTVVTATAGANTAGVDVVLADAAGVVDVASDGAHSTYGAFKVASAVLSVSKVVNLLCDPINGNTNPKNIPGAYVQYAVTITNAAGAASATLTTVTDTLVAQLVADGKLISGAGAPPLTACSASGTSLAASGFGAVYATGTTTTSYAAPGLATQAVTAGAAVAGQVVTITYGSLTGGGLGAFAGSGGVLPANSFITVYYNAIVQ